MKIETSLRVLVVEDEALIGMLIEDMLADIGCNHVDVAASVECALDAVAEASPDFAMLDINLNGERSFPVADLLRSRAIPFVFLSGYEPLDLGEAYAGTKILQKPFRLGDVETVLEDAFCAQNLKPNITLRST